MPLSFPHPFPLILDGLTFCIQFVRLTQFVEAELLNWNNQGHAETTKCKSPQISANDIIAVNSHKHYFCLCFGR